METPAAPIQHGVLMAAVSYHVFERQFLRLKGRFTPPRETAAATAAAIPGGMIDAGE